MDPSSFDSILRFAIEREEEAINAYGRLIEQVSNPALREMLEELREEERNHKLLLEHTSQKKIEDREVHDVVDLKISDYLVEDSLVPESSIQDLLIFAAKKEQKAVELYRELAGRVKREEFKKLFDYLIEQEKSHKLKLETEYERGILQED